MQLSSAKKIEMPPSPPDSYAGFLFICSNATENDTFKHGIFGLPAPLLSSMHGIGPRTSLFLYNFESRFLYGIFLPTSRPAFNLEPRAFAAALPKKFLAQVGPTYV